MSRADHRRAIRFALGVAASTTFIEMTEIPLGFLCSVLAAGMLAARTPRPEFGQLSALVLSIAASFAIGTALALTILQGPLIYYTAMILAIYLVLLHTARGAPVMPMLMLLLGSVLTPIVGVGSAHYGVDFAGDFVVASACAVLVVLFAYAVVPDPAEATHASKAATVMMDDPRESHDYALFRTLALLPLLVWVVSFNRSGDLATLLYAAILIQAPSAAGGREAGKSMIVGSLVGGAGAVFIYLVSSAFISLFVYLLLVGVVALLLGRALFSSSPIAAMCAKAPAALLILMDKSDALFGDQTADALVTRLMGLAIATLYVVVAGLLIESLQEIRRSRDGRAPMLTAN